MNSESPWATKRPIPFTNVSGETIPAFAAMAITGLVYENGIAFLQCDKPSAVFVREYAVNNMFDVPGGLRGTCFRAGDLRVLYDDAAPAEGEGWGPKPGQWSLSRGYPGFAVQGVVDSQHRIAKAFFESIAQVLVKTTAAVSANTNTTYYRIYTGTFGAEADAGFTTVPTARNRTGQSMASDEWAWLHWTNNGWELRCLQNRVYHATSFTAAPPGLTGSVILPDGRFVTFTNWSVDVTIDPNDKLLVWQDFTDSAWYAIKAGAENIDRVWYGTAVDPIAPGASGTVTRSDSITPEATNWSDSVAIATSDKLFIWLDSFDNAHYCIKNSSDGVRLFDCLLSADLSSTDPTVTVNTLVAYDGGALPADPLAGVSNRFGCSGSQSDAALIAYNESAGSYRLVQVIHRVREVMVDADYDQTTHELQKKTQQITAMHEAAAGNFVSYHSAVETDVVSNVFYDGALKKSIRSSAYVLEAPAAATVTVLAFTSESFVADVYMSGIDLHKTKRTLLTPALGAIADHTVFQGTTCPTSPGAAPSQSSAQQAAFMQTTTTYDSHNFTRPTLPQ